MRDNGYGIGVCGADFFLRETFLLRIFFGKSKTLPPIIGAISTLPVNKSISVLQNPMTSEKEKYNSLICAS